MVVWSISFNLKHWSDGWSLRSENPQRTSDTNIIWLHIFICHSRFFVWKRCSSAMPKYTHAAKTNTYESCQSRHFRPANFHTLPSQGMFLSEIMQCEARQYFEYVQKGSFWLKVRVNLMGNDWAGGRVTGVLNNNRQVWLTGRQMLPCQRNTADRWLDWSEYSCQNSVIEKNLDSGC